MKKNYNLKDRVIFTGYAEDLDEGQDPIFQKGDVLVIVKIDGDEEGKFIAHKEGDVKISDTVFFDEIEPAPEKPAKAKKETAKKAPAKKPAKKEETEEEPDEKTPAKKAVEKPAPKGKETGEEEVKLVDTKGVKSALKGKDILKTAKDLVAQAEETYFILGGVLAHIYYEQTYLRIQDKEKNPVYAGNKGFDRYVADELGVEYRKAMYLIHIYRHFSELGVDEKKLASIGWSKAKELVGIANPDNLDELLEFAKNHSRNELVDHIKETYVSDGSGTKGGTAKKVKFTFTFFEDKADAVLKALDLARERSEAETDDEALDFIITEWLSLSGETVTEEEAETEEATA